MNCTNHSAWTPVVFPGITGPAPALPTEPTAAAAAGLSSEAELAGRGETKPGVIAEANPGQKPATDSTASAETRSEGYPPPESMNARAAAASGPSPLSYADLRTAGRQGKTWIWQGYLATGNVTLLTSQWKTGKSTLIAVLLGRLKTGGELAGLRLSAGRAVVVSEEPASKWYERGQTLPFGDHLCWYCRPFLGKPRPQEWLDLLDQIGQMHEQQRIDLLVIDSFANLAPMRSENEATEVLKAVLPLQRLTSRGMSVLLSLHPSKGVVQPGQAARGSGALPGYADIIIEMDRVSRRNMKDRRRRLEAYSRHEETQPKWIIELSADGSDYLSLGECAEPSFERGWPVLKRLLEEADGPLTRRELLRQWPDEALPPARLTLWKWLDQVVKEGQVLREGAGLRKDPYRYRLPGMEQKWHEKSLERLMKLLE